MTDFVPVAQTGDLPKESSLAVEAGGLPLLICHSKGAFFAVANKCSHADATLDGGRVRAGWVACPLHGARFDLATGRAMNPPATQPIVTYPCRVVGDAIEVQLP